MYLRKNANRMKLFCIQVTNNEKKKKIKGKEGEENGKGKVRWKGKQATEIWLLLHYSTKVITPVSPDI